MKKTSFLTSVSNLFRPKKAVVTMDEAGVRRELSNGTVEHVTWAELARVEILTTDEGPFCEDFFWLLFGREGGVLVSGEDAQAIGLLDRLQKLPDFDNIAVIEASGSTDNARFLCWQAPAN